MPRYTSDEADNIREGTLTCIKKVRTSEVTKTAVTLDGLMNKYRSPLSHDASLPRRMYSAAINPHGESVIKAFIPAYIPMLSGL